MGGKGSGPRPLSDAEKKRRGTYQKRWGEDAYNAKKSAEIIRGHFLPTIPEPDLPLNPQGRKKYDDITKVLFEKHMLTTATKELAEQVGMLHMEQCRRIAENKPVPASITAQMRSLITQLKVTEDAPTLSEPGEKRNRFAINGFSNKRRA